jgi:hypothetical protein
MNPTHRTTALALLLLTHAVTTTYLPAQPADPPPATQSGPSEETIRLALEKQFVRSDSVEGHTLDAMMDNGIVAHHRDDAPVQKDNEFTRGNAQP